MHVTVPLTALDFDPRREGARATQGVEGRIPSRPGRAEVPFRAYFEPRGEPSVVVRIGRHWVAVAVRDLVAAADDALSAAAPLPSAFTTDA